MFFSHYGRVCGRYKKLIAMAIIFQRKIKEKSSAWIRKAVTNATAAREMQQQTKDQLEAESAGITEGGLRKSGGTQDPEAESLNIDLSKPGR